MIAPASTEPAPIAPPSRGHNARDARMLYLAGVFVIIAGFQLFVLSGRNRGFFAWTI